MGTFPSSCRPDTQGKRHRELLSRVLELARRLVGNQLSQKNKRKTLFRKHSTSYPLSHSLCPSVSLSLKVTVVSLHMLINSLCPDVFCFFPFFIFFSLFSLFQTSGIQLCSTCDTVVFDSINSCFSAAPEHIKCNCFFRRSLSPTVNNVCFEFTHLTQLRSFVSEGGQGFLFIYFF